MVVGALVAVQVAGRPAPRPTPNRAPLRPRRRAARGAILVEALIVIAALILFLLAFLYVHQAFSVQLQVTETSRAAALAFAMNGCEGGFPAGLAADDAKLIDAPIAAPGSNETVADAQLGKITEPAAASAFTKAASDNNGFGMPASASVGAHGTASVTDGKETLSSTLRSRTTLLCNEKPREGDLDNSISYIVDFMKF
jgi:Flp pilus assembly protein TadG